MQPKTSSHPKNDSRPSPEMKSSRDMKNLTSNDSKIHFTPISELDQLKIVNQLIDFLEAK
jgi:hypothetical protein